VARLTFNRRLQTIMRPIDMQQVIILACILD